MSTRPPYRRSDRPDHRAQGTAPQPRRFQVILHRAADKNLTFVARVLMELTRFGLAEAEYRMWESHHWGRSVVMVTHLERAEFYVEQFARHGLPASIEPA